MIRDLGGPGVRKYVAELRRWRRRHYEPISWGLDYGMCGAAALVHVIDSIRGRVVAHFYCQELRKMRLVIDNIFRIAKVLHQMNLLVPSHMYTSVKLKSLKNSESADFEKNLFSWLGE